MARCRAQALQRRRQLDVGLGEQEAALDHVAQLADIAGPAIVSEELQCLGGEPLLREYAGVELSQQCQGNLSGVLSALPQRRKGNGEYRQAIEQILAQLTVAHRL